MSARSSSPLSSPPRPRARRAPVVSDSDTDNDGYPVDQAPEDNPDPEENVGGDPEPVEADDVGVEALSTDGEDNGEDLVGFVLPPGAELEDGATTSTGEETAVSTQETVSSVGGGDHQALEDDPDGDYLPPGVVAAVLAIDDDDGYDADGSSDVAASAYGDDGHGPDEDGDDAPGGAIAAGDVEEGFDDAFAAAAAAAAAFLDAFGAGTADEGDEYAEEYAAYDDTFNAIQEAGHIDPPRSPTPIIPPSEGDSDSDFTIVGVKRVACFKVGTISDSGAAYPLFKKCKP
ncbi:hypothetical protein A4X13_0g7899 [Tilletia indica]|uniref:Uncharacterized protein n=1 Tax=Tilletia indica TaxID=43049 RepID=A0A177T503_9BASI|nr:hypothetical protein A4X13_0g7899 [Tilletia indica]